MRTSITDPIRIAEVRAPQCGGVIGVTFCPGKKDSLAEWDRDLQTDLDAIRDWGATCVVTLIETHEFALLSVQSLGREVEARGMAWTHLPIRDVSIPNRDWERQWKAAGAELCRRLRNGECIIVHCRGGIGRAGTVAARLLVELGMAPQEAVDAVRAARPGAMETPEQLQYVLSCGPAGTTSSPRTRARL